MSAAAVALADRRQVHHGCRIDPRPRIGTDSDLGAEAGFGEADGVHGLRKQVVGDELVEALQRVIGDVEVDGSVDAFRAIADERERFLMTLEQRRQKAGDEWLFQISRPAAWT